MKIKKIMLYQAIPFRGTVKEIMQEGSLVGSASGFGSSVGLIERGQDGYWFVSHGNERVEIGPANVAAIVYDATPVVSDTQDSKIKKAK